MLNLDEVKVQMKRRSYNALLSRISCYPDSHSTRISACEVWEDKGRGSNLQEGVSHIFTLRLG